MKNVNKFTVVAILFALFLTNSVLGDNIPTEGKWRDEYYRSADAPLPPVASIEGDILSLDFEDALSNLTVCVMNDRGVKRGRWNLFIFFSGRNKWPISSCTITPIGTLDR